MKTKKFFCTLLLVMACCTAAFAQSDSATDSKSSFSIGTYYQSRLHYYGRTDSVPVSGFFPLAEWKLNANFYLQAAPVFVSSAYERFVYAGTVATAGYQFGGGDKLAGHFYVVKPFYRPDAHLVQSALKAQMAGLITVPGKWINFSVGGDVKFSNRRDYGTTVSLDHAFVINGQRRWKLLLVPGVEGYAGTQQLNRSYLRKVEGGLLTPSREELVSESATRFNVLSYEWSMPVVLTNGRIEFACSPACVIPENLLSASGGAPGETGSKLLYITAGAKMRL